MSSLLILDNTVYLSHMLQTGEFSDFFVIIFMCICLHILGDFYSVNLILDQE